jgi:membrane protein YdbS with pleckstrin-like domain
LNRSDYAEWARKALIRFQIAMFVAALLSFGALFWAVMDDSDAWILSLASVFVIQFTLLFALPYQRTKKVRIDMDDLERQFRAAHANGTLRPPIHVYDPQPEGDDPGAVSGF